VLWWRYDGSALALPFPDNAFDVVLSQLGLQFFPDRSRALREARRVLGADGRLAVNVFGPIEHNPANHAVAAAMDRHVGREASVAKRTEHALGDVDQLRALVATSGFRNVMIQTEQKTVHFPSVADYVGIQLAATPLASVVADPDIPTRLIADISQALSPYVDSDGLSFPQEVHIVLASK
jgi:SAM-dependent methyltransferase